MEKETDIRQGLRVNVSPQTSEGDGPTSEALLVDVSNGGLRLAVEGPVPCGTEVRLRLDFGNAVIVHATARVVWCRPCAPYEVSTELLDLQPEQWHALERMVHPN